MTPRRVAHLVVILLVLVAVAFAGRSPVLAGDGVASWWHGEVAAVPSCIWPWDDCPPIAITSHLTGLRIVVTPQMYCQCYVGEPRERLVDLTLPQVHALGLDPADGTFAVTVDLVNKRTSLPNTALPGGPS